ncbi:DUF1287 domain-containing protein [Akkermansiaceae bacterium]|nr:DUF1287 domain-containing protein [Akkermansiaceae bacterium]
MRPIEYIGAAPVKKKRRSSFGGWLLVAFALSLGGVFLRPLIPFLKAQQELTSDANVLEAIELLESDGDFGSRLAAAALKRTQSKVTYDAAYYKIDFPNGDVPSDKGVCTDVVIRSYRSLGIDLQELVHADLKANFRAYPQLWKAKGPDTNIDHRRVPNLQRFFSRNGQALAMTTEESDYAVGDVVSWRLVNGQTHTGVVVPGPGARKSEKWIVHNIGGGPVWEDKLFDYKIIGHYRYGK